MREREEREGTGKGGSVRECEVPSGLSGMYVGVWYGMVWYGLVWYVYR